MEDNDDEYLPVEQLEHTVAEAREYEPAAQVPVVAVKPAMAQYDPAVHDEQLEEPAVAWKCPARQLEHTVADAVEYLPATQAPVTAVSPVVAQYDPPGQVVHAENPVDA